jgi:hypothetical protein
MHFRKTLFIVNTEVTPNMMSSNLIPSYCTTFADEWTNSIRGRCSGGERLRHEAVATG